MAHELYLLQLEATLLRAGFNITFIGKRLANVSTQDTVYSRQIHIYLESYYIPIYLYRYIGIYLSRSYRLNP
jgi:hypothetical protein